MSRREFLRNLGAAGMGAVTGVAAAGYVLTGDDDEPEEPPDEGPKPPTEPEGPSTPADTVRHASDFGTVVRAVSAGADPTGEEPVNWLFDQHAGDDTLLSFEPGTYRFRPLSLAGHAHLGIAAAGDEPPTFVGPRGLNLGSSPHLTFEGVDDLLLDRVKFDFRREGAGGEIRVIADGDTTIRDVSIRGSSRNQIAVFRIDVRDADAKAVIENLRAHNPGENPTLTGVYVGEPHAGEALFRSCELRGFSDNGLYGSSPGLPSGEDGVVRVEDGVYENNNISGVRLGSTGSRARGISIVVDSTPETAPVNLRGIRLRNKRDQVVEDSSVHIGADAGFSFGGIVFHPDNSGATVRNSEITVEGTGIPAIRAFPHKNTDSTFPTFRNLAITGTAAQNHAAVISGRDGTVFENCTIQESGSNRGGIRLIDSENVRIVDTTIDVTAHPVVLHQSTATIRNTTLVTPEGERYVDEMHATDGDFQQ